MRQTHEQLLQRYQNAKGNWQLWRSLYEEAYAYVNPDRNPWPDEVTPGVRKNIFVYDTTAVASARRLVSRLHASLLPPNENWFELTSSQSVPDADKTAYNQQLQFINDILYREIGRSNFDLVANETLTDLLIGTGAMMILECDSEDMDFICKSVAINKIYPEGDAYDEIHTVWREICKIRATEIEAFWPDAIIPSQIEQTRSYDPTVEYDFVEGYIYDRYENKYRHVVWADGINEVIVDIVETSSPWIVARWSKTTQEVGGRGPVIQALPTIRSANKLTEFLMQNVALSVSPPWIAASDGVFNPYLFEIGPNKVIPVSRQSMGMLPLQKLDVSGEIQEGSLELNDLRTQIKDLLFDNPIRPVDGPAQTATEISIRHQAFLEEIGPAWGRLSVEFQPKIIKRIIYILQKKGKIPKDFKINNVLMDIRFKSPLEQGAAFQAVQNLTQYLELMTQYLGPQVTLGSLNVPLLPQWLADKMGVDPNLIAGPGQIQQTMQNIMQQLQPPPAQPNAPQQAQQIANQPQQPQQQGQ